MPKPRTRANGTGTAYKRGRTWTAEVVVGYRETVSGTMRPVRVYKGGFPTKTAALEAIPSLKSKGLSNSKAKVLTINTLWLSYSQTAMLKLSKNKQTHYKTARKKIEDIAYIDLRLLTIDALQAAVDAAAPTHYPAKDIKTLLSQLYKRAVAEQYVSTNLADFIVLPSLNETETVPFTEDEIISLWREWQSAEDTICGYALLMIYTGMMPGELFELKKSMVNFESQTIIGAGIKTQVRKQKPIILPDIILPVLRVLCTVSATDYVLQMGREDFYKAFRAMVSRLGFNKDIHPYSCRHTTATTLGRTNTPLFAIKDVLRHSKITTTQRYVHMDTKPLIKAANNIGPSDAANG